LDFSFTWVNLVSVHFISLKAFWWITLQKFVSRVWKTLRALRAKFKTGDKVRILKKTGLYEKAFTPNWTEEVFTVSKMQRTNPVTYKTTDYNGEEIQGTFYEQELQKTSQEVDRIEKIVKKGKTKSLVKWKGYPESFNSWVDNKELIKLWNKWTKVLQ